MKKYALFFSITLSIWHLNADLFDNEDFFADVMVENEERDIGTRANEEIIQALVALLTAPSIVNLLAEQVYIRTNPPAQRPLHDLPSMQEYFFCHTPKGHISLLPFYNSTDRMFFNRKGPFLDSQVGLRRPSLVQAIERVINELQDTFNTGEDNFTIDVPRILGLFAPLRLQERRAGIIFSSCFSIACAHFGIHIPLYYLEHNFFLSKQERCDIEAEPFFTQTATQRSSDEDNVDLFIEQHFIADRIGIGDLRFHAGINIFENDHHNLMGYLELTFPIDGTFEEGLIGCSYPKRPRQPDLDLLKITALVDPSFVPDENETDAANEAGQMLTNFAINALDRITRIVADRPLGSEHFGLGPAFHYAYTVDEQHYLTALARIQYLSPRTRVRFFNERSERLDAEALNEQAETDPRGALAVIEQEIVNTLFPQMRDTRIEPKISVELNGAFHRTTENTHMSIGYDVWYRHEDEIELKNKTYTNLSIQKATRPRALQTKIFANASFITMSNHYLWHLGIFGDYTFEHTGIGRDSIIGVRITMDF